MQEAYAIACHIDTESSTKVVSTVCKAKTVPFQTNTTRRKAFYDRSLG